MLFEFPWTQTPLWFPAKTHVACGYLTAMMRYPARSPPAGGLQARFAAPARALRNTVVKRDVSRPTSF